MYGLTQSHRLALLDLTSCRIASHRMQWPHREIPPPEVRFN